MQVVNSNLTSLVDWTNQTDVSQLVLPGSLKKPHPFTKVRVMPFQSLV